MDTQKKNRRTIKIKPTICLYDPCPGLDSTIYSDPYPTYQSKKLGRKKGITKVYKNILIWLLEWGWK